MDTEELVSIVTDSAYGYEEIALEQARAELQGRGIEEQALEPRLQRASANRRLREELDRADAADRLPTWAFLVCVFESGVLTLAILLYLALRGRANLLAQAGWAIGLGWALKLIAMAILSAYL